MRETTPIIVARIEERLKGFVEINAAEHKQIVGLMTELKAHVNEENEALEKKYESSYSRLKVVEEYCNTSKITWKVLAKIATATITVIGIAIALVKLMLGV